MKLSLIIMAVAGLTLFSNVADAGHPVPGQSYDSYFVDCNTGSSMNMVMAGLMAFDGFLKLTDVTPIATEHGCKFENKAFVIHENICSFVRVTGESYTITKSQTNGKPVYVMVQGAPEDVIVTCNAEMLNALPNME